MAERQPDFPLHRLNIPRTKMWLISESTKRRMAAAFARMYRGGVGICSATLRLMAVVNPNGTFRELAPPFKKYEMWQIANKPAVPVCPCADFFDPEVGGPWSQRGPSAGHHPHCQFDQTSMAVFVRSQQLAAERIGLKFTSEGVPYVGEDSQASKDAAKILTRARPDEWLKLRQEYRGR